MQKQHVSRWHNQHSANQVLHFVLQQNNYVFIVTGVRVKIQQSIPQKRSIGIVKKNKTHQRSLTSQMVSAYTPHHADLLGLVVIRFDDMEQRDVEDHLVAVVPGVQRPLPGVVVQH